MRVNFINFYASENISFIMRMGGLKIKYLCKIKDIIKMEFIKSFSVQEYKIYYITDEKKNIKNSIIFIRLRSTT